jgi:catechol 2,3-dioxygenase-like lactoylglutathione lyase family enzyme
MTQSLTTNIEVSDLFQVGIVVRDLDQSMELYKNLLGIDSWQVFEITPETNQFTYHGKPVEHSFRAAFTMLGKMMVELLEPLEGEGIYRDFLDEHGEGIHHLGHVRVEDLDKALQELEEAGFPCIETGADSAGFHSWAYVDTTAALGYILELSTGFDPRAIFEENLSEEDLRSKLKA